ncbi:unnamed protein product [Sphenostylis stenocarpa]|uniref:Desiccation-related protein PCC13-62 n=1 Tax=Sphenostylis stenocarpa TaxID=92480 RepID=A0AA86SAY6_9FABA|nr:unnamed protein product [Sphenostylis stenocarpa]
MALRTVSTAVFLTSIVLALYMQRASSSEVNVSQTQPPISDQYLLEFVLNLEYLSAEFFSCGANGRGLDATAPQLTKGGPPPVGGRKANLNPFFQDIFSQFTLIKIGHLRAINGVVKGFPIPLLNISKELFGKIVDDALGQTLRPSFDPYANSLNYLLGAYIISDLAPPGYVGITPQLQNVAVIRAYLYERRNYPVQPYGVNVSELTDRISELANRLGKEGTKSEGIVVPLSQGAEGRIEGNVIGADNDSLAYGKMPGELLRIVYGTSDEHVPGDFYPKGANGRIARSFLSRGT